MECLLYGFITLPRINDSIDVVLERVYAESDPFWAPPCKMVDDEYRSFEFPFEPVEGIEHTGPFEFRCILGIHPVLVCILDNQAKGFELLREEVVEDFKHAWGEEDERHNIKVEKFSIFLRIRKVGNE